MSEIKLTNTERAIMEVIWADGEMSNSQIHEVLSKEHDWSRHMVKVYTKYLVDKGVLKMNQISQRKIKFYPLISKDEYLANRAEGFLRQNYNGLSNMVAGLINNEKVTSEEINELEKLIQDFRDK